MWDSRLVTTLRLAPDAKDIVVRKITEKVFEDHDDQELYHKKTLAWVPESTNAKDLNLMTAAPELLKALKSLIQSLPDDPDSYEDSALYRQIKDAVNKGKNIITKATGENYA